MESKEKKGGDEEGSRETALYEGRGQKSGDNKGKRRWNYGRMRGRNEAVGMR